jgi:hypothetical protein
VTVWVSDWLLFNAKWGWREQATFQWGDDDVCFVLDQHDYLDFYSASSLKQLSAW